MTALVITASYHTQEFFRIGYYITHEYDNDEMKTNPPDQINYDRLVRVIFA